MQVELERVTHGHCAPGLLAKENADIQVGLDVFPSMSGFEPCVVVADVC